MIMMIQKNNNNNSRILMPNEEIDECIARAKETFVRRLASLYATRVGTRGLVQTTK